MSEFLYTLLVVFIIVVFAFAIFNIKFIVKGEEFKKTCSTTGEKCSCSTDHDHESTCENKLYEKI